MISVNKSKDWILKSQKVINKIKFAKMLSSLDIKFHIISREIEIFHKFES
jgi:hypothetical protein